MSRKKRKDFTSSISHWTRRLPRQKEERTVRNDFTILHNGTLYQIGESTRAQKVLVEDRLDGTVRITYKSRELRYREISRKQVKEEPKAELSIRKKEGGLLHRNILGGTVINQGGGPRTNCP